MTVSDEPAGAWYETLSRRTVHDGWSSVHVDRVRMPDGSEVDREVVEHIDAVAVVALMGEDVLLLRQYRHPIGRHVLEIPAGVLDVAGEDPAGAAARELREEVGVRADRLEHLTTFLNSAGWTDERTHVYVARDVETAPAPDGFTAEAEEAHMEVVRMPLAAAVEAVRDGSIVDAKTVIGLLLVA